MRAEFNEDEQLVITSMGITEKMALSRWKELASSGGSNLAKYVVVNHRMPVITNATSKEAPKRKSLYCSFCGKSQHEVENLIAGPAVYICEGCVTLCNQIVDENTLSGGEK